MLCIKLESFYSLHMTNSIILIFREGHTPMQSMSCKAHVDDENDPLAESPYFVDFILLDEKKLLHQLVEIL